MTAQNGRAALITGGTTGIGLATARLFHEQGYAVLITGANPETLEAARRILPSEIIVVRADARSLEDAAHVAWESSSGSAGWTWPSSTRRRPHAADRGDR
jgi:NAD(P)-dependent dehydrogenase (short-subunit alcohol dehydrogenase family)